LTCHVTAVFEEFDTVAENCCVAPVCTFAVGREIMMVTAGGGGAVEEPVQPATHATTPSTRRKELDRRVVKKELRFFTKVRSIESPKMCGAKGDAWAGRLP
jgi:hypothetical protein